MNILALDLGTHTGYCQSHPKDGYIAGTWDLASKAEITQWNKDRTARRRDPRVIRLFEKLGVVSPKPDVVVFEDVQFRTYTYQTQLWSSFRAAVWLAFPLVICEAVPVGVLKIFATGYGGANKETMAKWLYRRFPKERTMGLDDNAIDAIWLYKWAEQHLCRIKL